MIEIRSGGQSGVDRAALDAALAAGLRVGGWCPKGRRAEDGRIANSYPLKETPSENYEQRTEWNVRDADATLIIARGPELQGGTLLTARIAAMLEKPVRAVDLSEPNASADAARWIAENGVRVLNVAGPRESVQPGIYAEARRFLGDLLEQLSAAKT